MGGVEVYLHSLLTSALDEGEQLVSRPGPLYHWPQGRFRRIPEEKKNLAPNEIRTPDNPACSIVAVTTTMISHDDFLRYKMHTQIIPPIPALTFWQRIFFFKF